MIGPTVDDMLQSLNSPGFSDSADFKAVLRAGLGGCCTAAAGRNDRRKLRLWNKVAEVAQDYTPRGRRLRAKIHEWALDNYDRYLEASNGDGPVLDFFEWFGNFIVEYGDKLLAFISGLLKIILPLFVV